jgi:5-formyltetrahydrofolate cyclo-ligase
MSAKAEARREARTRLAALTSAERAAASAAIAAAVWTVPAVAAARSLLLYASTTEEADTDAIAAEAVRRGIEVVYPRCVVETLAMTLHCVAAPEPGRLLRTGAYGLREPDAAACAEVRADSIDVALVPGLAWDRRGTRLGRGAGYYDRLFAVPGWRAARVGLFFAVQELGTLPADPWDAPLDATVTEREVWLRAE